MIKKIVLLLSAGLAGCTVVSAPQRVYVPVPQPAYQAPMQNSYPQSSDEVSSVEVEAPLAQPEPVMIDWAPPPMLVEAPPPQPFVDAVWIGGYWVWRGDWVWARGRWAPLPRPGCYWVHPYYEHRGNAVIFVDGFWAPPGVVFIAPPAQAYIRVAVVNPGVIHGVRPIGPVGVFVPPPPGSRPGLIIPAPIGTPPAVVIGAPPVNNVGMYIQVNNTSVHNHTTIINNVTVVAPPNATISGRPFNSVLPAQAHLAAQQTPQVRGWAPPPAPRPQAVPANNIMPSMTPAGQQRPYVQQAPVTYPSAPQPPRIERAPNLNQPQPVSPMPLLPSQPQRPQIQPVPPAPLVPAPVVPAPRFENRDPAPVSVPRFDNREGVPLRTERQPVSPPNIQPQAVPQPRIERQPEIRPSNPVPAQEIRREGGRPEASRAEKETRHAEQREHAER